MITDPIQQQTRRGHLQELADVHHRSRHGDYNDNYASFAAAYGLEWDEPIPLDEIDAEAEAIPKYASIASDETYGAISVFNTLREALHHQSIISEMGETLNVPSGIVDLDSNEHVYYEMYAMTRDMVALIAACVAPSSEGINSGGIFSDAWQELQTVFPPVRFHEWAQAHPGHDQEGDEFLDPPDPHNYYEPDAGE